MSTADLRSPALLPAARAATPRGSTHSAGLDLLTSTPTSIPQNGAHYARRAAARHVHRRRCTWTVVVAKTCRLPSSLAAVDRHVLPLTLLALCAAVSLQTDCSCQLRKPAPKWVGGWGRHRHAMPRHGDIEEPLLAGGGRELDIMDLSVDVDAVNIVPQPVTHAHRRVGDALIGRAGASGRGCGDAKLGE